MHAKDGGRIKYQRVCSIDGEEVAYADIAKGYETEDGEMVILTDDDMAELPSTSSREIAVEKFVPSDQIDPMLLREVLLPRAREVRRQAVRPAPPGAARRRPDGRGDGRAAPAHHRSRCCACKDDVIVLQTMMWPDEVRDARLLASRPARSRTPRSRWRRCWSRRWPATSTPSEFEDDYAEAVEALVKAKIEGGEVKRTPTSTKSSGEVVDLLAALQRSVDAAEVRPRRGRRDETPTTKATAEEGPGEEGGRQEGRREEGPAKKTAAKKTTSKKAAKKAPVRKAELSRSRLVRCRSSGGRPSRASAGPDGGRRHR